MPELKTVVVLGSTGSIGRRALEILATESNANFRIVGLAAGNNAALLGDQIQYCKPGFAAVASSGAAAELAGRFPEVTFFSGEAGLLEMVDQAEADIVISAISGTVSMAANLRVLEKGARLCLANKETLVAAGDLVKRKLESGKGELIPVDSEHSAIYQCLYGQPRESLARIILTASGGPFFKSTPEDLQKVTLEMALRHPTWKMGRKITIDSATMMNKALELIEASVLFLVGEREIRVVIHPQSIVHSMVEFHDGSVLAQMGMPDMGLPIHYALNHPCRPALDVEPLRLEKIGSLEFFPEESTGFSSIALARSVVRTGKSAGAVFNAANEAAVEAFVKDQIGFLDIVVLVEEILSRESFHPINSLDDVAAAIENTRSHCREWLERKTRS